MRSGRHYRPLSKPKEKSQDVALVPIPEELAPPPGNYPESRSEVAVPVFKRLDTRSEEDLRKELVQVPIFRKDQIPKESLRLLAAGPGDKAHAADTMPDFAGLPMRMGVNCQSGKEPAEKLQVVSRKLHSLLVFAVSKDG